jgi:hypothetical protein
METEMQNPMAESQMKLVVEGRRQMVYEGLIADSVVTAGTLWDTYEIRAEEAQAFHLYTTTRPVDTPTEPGDGPDVTFVMFEPRFLECSTRQLCVYAGVAELRHQLGVQPHAWEYWSEDFLYKGFSKGYWHVGEEKRIAVDYDVGDEDIWDLADRALYYRKEFYLTQIWGAPTRARCDELEEALKTVTPSVQVLYAPYAPNQTWDGKRDEEALRRLRRRDAVRAASATHSEPR